MSSQFSLSVHSSLADRLSNVDDAWLVDQLESACDEYEQRHGGPELGPYDDQEELKSDNSLTEARRKQLLIKWRRQMGGPRR